MKVYTIETNLFFLSGGFIDQRRPGDRGGGGAVDRAGIRLRRLPGVRTAGAVGVDLPAAGIGGLPCLA